MSFGGLILTNQGRNKIAAAISNEQKLHFTHIQMGDGIYKGSYLSIKELQNKIVELPVTRVSRKDNEVTIECDWNSTQAPKGFYFREIGIIGNGVLCYYDNAGTGDAEYIDPASEVLSKEKRIRLIVVVSADLNVTVHTASNLYALKEETEANIQELRENADKFENEVATNFGKKLDKTGDASDVTVEFNKASKRENISPKEKLSVVFGKISKFWGDLKEVAFTGSYNDLSDKPNISAAIENHNTSETAHEDIRDLISGLNERLVNLADCDDTTLDQLSEIVSYIKSNRSLIENVTTNKINVSDIVDNLTSTAGNKVLSAKQGKVLNELITELKNNVDDKVNKSGDKMTGDLTVERGGDARVKAKSSSKGNDISLIANESTGSVGLWSESLKGWLLRYGTDGVANFDSRQVFLKKGSMVSIQSGTQGTDGFVKIIQIKILRSYVNRPIIFEVSGKGWSYSRKLYVYFKAFNGTDPDLGAFSIDGTPAYSIGIVKSSTSTWDIYMQKNEPYGECHICSMHTQLGNDAIQMTFPNEQVSTMPSGYIAPTVMTWDKAEIANKLATARTISLDGDLVGSANFDGSENITINAHEKYSTCTVNNTNNYPFHRFAYTNKVWSGSMIDYGSVFKIVKGRAGGGVGIFQVGIRTNGAGTNSTMQLRWLVRDINIPVDCIKAGFNNTSGNTTVDLFYKSGNTYDGCVIYRMNNTGRHYVMNDPATSYTIRMCNSYEASDTTTSDKKTSFEVYASMSAAASALGKTFVSTMSCFDAGYVSNAYGAASVIDYVTGNNMYLTRTQHINNFQYFAVWGGATDANTQLGIFDVADIKDKLDLRNNFKYEEGTWSPEHGYMTSTNEFILSTGTYTKIGNVVIARCKVEPGYTDGAHTIHISPSSLPFPLAGDKFILGVLQNPYDGSRNDGKFTGAITSITFGERSFLKSIPEQCSCYATIIYRI